ncbi:50S ribosomal protein L25 [Haloferula sargassicola]|uniref:Large ribosomal subunit protein bL25 n=1 Tax=Haloferula sargassicola TaxID=490096 RepID=A0ABP9URG2_9BACT
MAKKHSLKAELRARTGSGLLKQMRREGWLPSVIYGKGTEPTNLKVDAKAFGELLRESESENILINLEVAGDKSRLAFLQSIQHEPMSGEPLHADFLAVDEKTQITAHVPVHLTGEATGVKAGGVLEQMLHTLDIHCAATHLPELLEFDVSKLGEGESLHIGDVKFPDGVSPAYADDVVIAHIGKPKVADESAAEESAAPVAAAAE